MRELLSGGIQDAPDLAGGRRDLRFDISAVLAEGTDKRTDESEAREREQIAILLMHICVLKACARPIKFTIGAMIVW
jgi:hypothetical protein